MLSQLDSGRNSEGNPFLAADSLRMNEVRGLGEFMREAYLALEGPTGPVIRDPYEVLGIRPDAPLEVAEASYRALAKVAHPDAGGSEAKMAELNAAIERVRSELPAPSGQGS